MPVKPTNTIGWTSTTGGSQVEPTGGEKVAGYAPGDKPPAEYFNWFWALVTSWIVWLNAFEATAHTWALRQTFTLGVDGTSDGSNFAGVTGIGTNNEHGVQGTSGNGTGSGVRGLGIGVNSAGVSGLGGSAAPGVLGNSGGTGPGVSGTSGGTGAGVEGTGTGAGDGVKGTNSSSNGNGVHGVATGAVGTGVLGEGTGAAGYGVRGLGAVGGSFSRNDADSTKPAIISVGVIDLASQNALPATRAVKKQVAAESQVKAWAVVACNGTTTPTLVDGFNIAGVTQHATSGLLTFTLPTGAEMVNSQFGVFAHLMGTTLATLGHPTSMLGGSFDLAMIDVGVGGTPSILSTAALSGTRVWVEVKGRQVP
jgi:hypothetical protein